MGLFCKLFLLVIYDVAVSANVFTSPKTKVIESFHVKSDIRYRFATTQIESVVRNTAEVAQEIVFDVTLPKEAFIVNFSMEIDGKTYNGEVKEKSQAKKVYQEALDRGESAGHVRQTPRHSNMFDVSTNVESGSAAKFTLTYQELLHKKFGIYEHEIHVNPGQVVDNFLIEIFIQENRPLTFVKTPTLRSGSLITNRIEADKRLTVVDRPSSRTAHITYKPTLTDQGTSGVSARFVVEYGIDSNKKGEVMQTSDGYFVHFFSPQDYSPMPKDIVFVLDISGSMIGTKIEQLKQAMMTILDNLYPEDRFNILTFSFSVKPWQQTLVLATETMVIEAKKFVTSMYGGGGTDINSALLAGISEIKATEEKRVGMIFFLTDGLPSYGVTYPQSIAANVLKSNGKASLIFSLAFGSDADYNLVTTISAQNNGFARKIYTDSDAALQVSSLYNEISAVAIKGFSINYLPSSVDQCTLTNHKFPVIFNNSEVIVGGKIANNAQVFELMMTGTNKTASFNTVLNFDVTNLTLNDESLNTFFTMPRDFSGIIEKMWAYLTIKQYLRETEIHVTNGTKVEELNSKVLQMSLKYKFVTPLTSMVVTKPDSSDKPIVCLFGDRNDIVTMKEAVMNSMQSNAYHPGRSAIIVAYHPDSFDILPRRTHHIIYDWPIDNDESIIFDNDEVQNTVVAAVDTTQMSTNVPPGYIKASPSLKIMKDTGFHVSAITAETANLSFCLAPKKIKDGTYKLIQLPNGVELSINTRCTRKQCKKLRIKSVVLKANGDIYTISLDQNGDWIWDDNPTFIISLNQDVLTLSVEGIMLNITKIQKNKKKYIMAFSVNSPKGFEGLIGSLLNMRPKLQNKWRKFRVPAVCKDKAKDISNFLNNKLAAKYKV